MTGSSGSTLWQLRQHEKRHLSDIFNVYKNNEHIYSTPRTTKYHLLHNVAKYARIFSIPVCLIFLLSFFVRRHDDSSLFLAFSETSTEEMGNQREPINSVDNSGLAFEQLHNKKYINSDPHSANKIPSDYEKGNHAHEESLLDSTHAQKVLLLTYFRGGSTFLGEVFNHNRDAFYWFEPLAAPMFAYKKQHNSKDYMLTASEGVRSRPSYLVDSFVDILQQVFDCDIDSLDTSVMKHYFATNWHKSAKFYKYQTCIHRHGERHGGNVTDAAVRQCKRFLERQCVKSQLRVIKSIRLFVEEALPILHMDPDVKIVYYIRDPRGVLLSRWSLARLDPTEIGIDLVEQSASYLCAKMRVDLEIALKLQTEYPDRVIMMRYEDLAIDPVNTVRGLYAFLGVNVPNEVVSWIHYATHAVQSDGKIGTKRENATAVASRWHDTLTLEEKEVIADHCDDVIDVFYSTEFVYDHRDHKSRFR